MRANQTSVTINIHKSHIRTDSWFIVTIYQLDFFTPGIWPVLASSRKHILHISKARIYPCFLPHLQQRLTIRVENFGFFLALASTDFFAI